MTIIRILPANIKLLRILRFFCNIFLSKNRPIYIFLISALVMVMNKIKTIIKIKFLFRI